MQDEKKKPHMATPYDCMFLSIGTKLRLHVCLVLLKLKQRIGNNNEFSLLRWHPHQELQ